MYLWRASLWTCFLLFMEFTEMTTAIPLPFMLLGGDLALRVQVEHPVCVFVSSLGSNRNADLVFTGVHADSTLGAPVSADSFLQKTNYSDRGDFALFGMHCFEDTVDRVQMDYGAVFSGLPANSNKWRSVVYYFMSKERVQGTCTSRGMFNLGGNVFGPSGKDETQSISLHSDCPVVFLTPTGVDGACPTNQFVFTDSPPLPQSVRVDVATVRSAARNIPDLSIFSLTTDNAQSFDAETVVRSAISIASNASEWHDDIFGVRNIDSRGDQCSVSRRKRAHWKQPINGYIDLDPLFVVVGGSDFTYELQIFQGNENNDALQLQIEPYDSDCVALDVRLEDLTWNTKAKYHNPTGNQSLVVPTNDNVVGFNGGNVVFEISRRTTEECDLATVRIWYSLVNSNASSQTALTSSAPPPTTTTGPQTTSTPHAPVTVPLPFMLFGGDRVPAVEVNHAVCVFVTSVSSNRNSAIVFTGRHRNGSLDAPLTADSFLHRTNYSDEDNSKSFALFGVHCFEDTVNAVNIHYGDQFSGLEPNSSRWRSVIFYFMAKEKVQGICASGGIFGGNVFAPDCSLDFGSLVPCRFRSISVHRDCPAVFLTPTAVNVNSNCPILVLRSNGLHLPENTALELATVPSGVEKLYDLSIFTLTNDNMTSFDNETLLRSAITIRTNSSSWLRSPVDITNSDDSIHDSTCRLVRQIIATRNKLIRGYIDVDLMSAQDIAYFGEIENATPFEDDQISFDFEPYDAACLAVDVRFVDMFNEVTTEFHNPVGVFNTTLPLVDNRGLSVRSGDRDVSGGDYKE